LESDRADYQVFNVGGGKAITVREFAEIVANVFDKDKKPLLPLEYRFGDTRHIFSDISKIKKIGWEPKRSIYDSVEEYKTYLTEQTDIEDILDYTQKQMKKLGVVRRVNDN